ncbi:MAG TPA: hypothetical protein VJZ49_11690 [Syntrophales bacterium]|nr:hypothetical protein [Syntrophales bacterium]
MLEDGVAESVPGDVGHRPTAGQRHGGPEVTPLFIAEVERLPARIAHGIVMPGSEAKLVGILGPGVGRAALGDDGTKILIRQDICPWRRRHLVRRGGNDVLVTVRGESAESVEKQQIVAGLGGNCRGSGTVSPSRYKGRHLRFHQPSPVYLLRQHPPAVGDDGAGDRLEQDAFLARYLVRRPYENTARLIRHAGAFACGNEPHYLFLELLPITGMIFVPDHHVHRQSF